MAIRTNRGRSDSAASTLSGVSEIKSVIADPETAGRSRGVALIRVANGSVDGRRIRPSLDQNVFPRPGFAGRGQRWCTIIVAFAARQAGICTRYQPCSLQPEPQRFPMDRGDDLEGDEGEQAERPQ